MNQPLVSVLMSVYNAASYLREAVDSILAQTFSDFEFIILDDGSTDRTAEILDSYSDLRIVRLTNVENIGLAASLNEGIEIAQGEYIARMDADDVSLPERLELQVAYLDSHPEITAVFSKISLFSAQGKPKLWKGDEENVTVEQIRATLPHSCCVAHPTLLIRSGVLKKYRYDLEQFRSEDWDLWLRLISDGHLLAKIDSQLLRYRVHDDSETQQSLRDEGWKKKIYNFRNRFLQKQFNLGKWGEVEKQVFYHHVTFLFSHFRLPEILSLYPHCFRMSGVEETMRELVINFRKIDGGGIERVSVMWANEFAKRGHVVTMLTDVAPSPNDYPLSALVRRVAIPRTKEYLENFYKFVERNATATYIINDDYTELCYKKILLLKMLGKRVIVANHGVWYVPAHPGTRWEEAWKFRPAVFGLIDATICSSLFDKAYWNWAGIKNVLYIHNPLPFEISADSRSSLGQPLVVWVGRFSKEKQPELMIEVFAQVKQQVPDAKLCMVGDGVLLEKCKEKAEKMNISSEISFPGFVDDVQPYLRQASVHCITSEYEAFSMIWLEAKAHGLPTILFRLSNLEMSAVPGSVSIEKYDTAAFANQVARLLNDLSARKEMGEQAFLSLHEFSHEKAFERWELLFRFLSSQGNMPCKAFDENCPPEQLNRILFEQTSQILNDWMEYGRAQKMESKKNIKQLSSEWLDAVWLGLKKTGSKIMHPWLRYKKNIEK